jgi:hypothetical protein
MRYVAREIFNALPIQVAENTSTQPLAKHRSIDPQVVHRLALICRPPVTPVNRSAIGQGAGSGVTAVPYGQMGSSLDLAPRGRPLPGVTERRGKP